MNHLHNEESAGRPGSAPGLDFGGSDSNLPMEKGAVDPSAIGPMRSSSVSSDTVACCASLVEPSLLASSYLAPLDDMAARYQDERRYRMLLQHDYHTIRKSFIPFIVIPFIVILCHKSLSRHAVTLPLWRPSHVEVGAVGFPSKPDGRFETLMHLILGRHLAATRTGFRCCLVTARFFRVTSDSTSIMPRNVAFIVSRGSFLRGT
jgi:abelson tyrosine-protein kinase 1/abelson tyrosine-protein kinase 2